LLRYRLGFAIAVFATFGAGCFTDPVNMAPTVRIQGPFDPKVPGVPLASFFRGDRVTYTATASDSDGNSVSLWWLVTTGDQCPADFELPSQWPTGSWGLADHRDLTPMETAGTFCVWVKAVDGPGAASVDARTGVPMDHPPKADLKVVAPGEAKTFQAGTSFILSAEDSTDPDPGDTLKFAWSMLSSPNGETPMPCPNDPSNMKLFCLTADAAGDYEVELTVTDLAGMTSVIDKTLRVLPGQAAVGAIDLVSPTTPPPYKLGAEMRVTSEHSVLGTLLSDGSVKRAWKLQPAPGSALPDTPDRCDGDATDETACFVPDVSGDYFVTLTITNGAGDSTPVTVKYNVAPDQPPCIAVTTPGFDKQATSAMEFDVLGVDDDLDPFPGVKDMNWYVSVNNKPFELAQHDWEMLTVNKAAFSPLDTVKVRLEVHDRNTDRSAQEFLACGDADTCTSPSLVHSGTCYQRFTWTLILQAQ
jgi:hypothetical protein